MRLLFLPNVSPYDPTATPSKMVPVPANSPHLPTPISSRANGCVCGHADTGVSPPPPPKSHPQTLRVWWSRRTTPDPADLPLQGELSKTLELVDESSRRSAEPDRVVACEVWGDGVVALLTSGKVNAVSGIHSNEPRRVLFCCAVVVVVVVV